MLTLLVPVDGSPTAQRAVDHAIKLAAGATGGAQIHLLNVQIPVVSGVVKMFIDHNQINAYYREEATKVLDPVRRKIEQAGVSHQHHIGIGRLADTIVGYAKQYHCDQIIMGSRGMSAISNLVLGSVATQVIHLSEIPVTLVK
jgi:nucleotide-binding universal stress UspA family protein